MIDDFEDLCLHMYCMVDDIWKGVSHRFSRPAPNPIARTKS